VRREERVEHAARRDQPELDSHHNHEPCDARPHRDEADHPAGAQDSQYEDEPVLSEPRGERPCDA